MKRRLKKLIFGCLALLALGICYAVWCIKTELYIPCVFHKLTGLYCPGCGVSHMLMALARLDFGAAFMYHPVLFVLMFPGIFFVLRWMTHYVRNGKIGLSRMDHLFIWGCAGVLLIYGVVRNLS